MKFPQKLWDIINNCDTHAIRWSDKGSTILIDYSIFQEQYLSSSTSVFKTRNINSFVRQLNLYGFRKVTSAYRDPAWNLQNPNIHEFYHKHFRACKHHLLVNVVRKAKHSKKLNKHIKFDHQIIPDKENIYATDISSNLLMENKNTCLAAGKQFSEFKENKHEELRFFPETPEMPHRRLAMARTALRRALEEATAKSLPSISSIAKEECYEDNDTTALPAFLPEEEESSELIVPDMPSDVCINLEEKSSFPLLTNADSTFQIFTPGHATFDKLHATAEWSVEDMSLPADFSYNDIGQHADLMLQHNDHQSMYDRINFPNDANIDQHFEQNDSNTIVQNFLDIINDLPPSTFANKFPDYVQTYSMAG